jgi:ATP synthase protein I
VAGRRSLMWQRFRPVFGLQVLATVAAALLSAWLAGRHGAASAALGGSANIVAGLAYVALASRSTTGSAGEALYGALRAEAVKVVLMLLLLLGVLMIYKSVVAAALIGTFVLNVVVFTMAIFVADEGAGGKGAR